MPIRQFPQLNLHLHPHWLQRCRTTNNCIGNAGHWRTFLTLNSTHIPNSSLASLEPTKTSKHQVLQNDGATWNLRRKTYWKRHLPLQLCETKEALLLCVCQLEENNEKLAALANEPDTLSQPMLRAIQRHREVFQDNVRELNRTKVCFYECYCPLWKLSLC